MLCGNWAVLAPTVLLVQLLLLFISELLIFSDRSVSLISLAASLAVSLFAGVLDAGLHLLFLSAARERPIRILDVFAVFRSQPDKPIVVSFLTILLNLAAALPFLAAGTYLLRSPMASIPPGVYTGLLPILLALPLRALLLLAGLALLWAVPAAALSLCYSLALFLYADRPHLSGLELMRQSRRMMRGQKRRLLWLYLSFTGYFLLGVLSLGIGFLWVLPYVRMAHAIFYLELKAQEGPPAT